MMKCVLAHFRRYRQLCAAPLRCTEEPLPAVEPAPEPASPEAAGENPAPKAGKSKKAKEPKAKKPPAPKKPRSPPSHPPYEELKCQELTRIEKNIQLPNNSKDVELHP
ncbi:hypothetical protein NL676_012090 [Syzygium grande]|nr:hypothetical protein NL676_012090 [Syzygium grande]